MLTSCLLLEQSGVFFCLGMHEGHALTGRFFVVNVDKRTHRIALAAARVSMIDIKAEDIRMVIHAIFMIDDTDSDFKISRSGSQIRRMRALNLPLQKRPPSIPYDFVHLLVVSCGLRYSRFGNIGGCTECTSFMSLLLHRQLLSLKSNGYHRKVQKSEESDNAWQPSVGYAVNTCIMVHG